MDRPNTIHGLKVIRSEMAGQIKDMQVRLEGLKIELMHVDATLEILGVKNPKTTLKPKYMAVSGLFMRNELPRMIMTEFKESKTPITAREIAIRVIRIKGWDMSDPRLEDAMAAKVGRVLDKSKRRVGFTRTRKGNTHYWELD